MCPGYILTYCSLAYNISSALLAGIFSSLAVNPHSKLRSLEFHFGIFSGEERGDTIFNELSCGLRQLSEKNVLEVLKASMIGFNASVSPHPDWKVAWSADIDQMLNDIRAFPVLRQVVFKVPWVSRGGHIYSNLEDDRLNLTRAKFRRLCESKVIKFELLY